MRSHPTLQRIAYALLLLAVYAFGAFSHQNRIFPTPQLEAALRRNLWRLREERGFKDVTDRRPVDCAELNQPGSAIVIALGQSNAANESELRFQPGDGVFNFNFFDGKCYAARDPLLGATGEGGSVWSQLGDKLVRSGAYRRVLIAPIAVGGSRVLAWTPEGVHFSRIEAVQKALSDAGLKATHVLWHQGESDARWTSKEDYIAQFGSMLAGMRRIGIDAPVYVAVASLCRRQPSEAIRAAQRELPQLLPNVRPGPDTDELDRFRWRRDGCHFSAEGLEKHADLWVRALNR
jgi:hypothetical protein